MPKPVKMPCRISQHNIDRFMSYVAKSSESPCWLWKGGKNSNGYGQFGLNGQTVGAHRVSYEIHKGPIPKRLHVLHTCDNPSCVNPNHLFTGTNTDNMADMTAKGRSVYGEKHHSAKLTADQVVEIRIKLRRGVSQRTLARQYGVSHYPIHCIAHGKIWKSVKMLNARKE